MATRVDNSHSQSTGRCAALIVMVGAPGSGKSYLGRTLSAALDAKLIQTDAVRKAMFPDPNYSQREASAVYAACHQQISDALRSGERVVFDGTNLREKQRATLYSLADRAQAKLIVVVAYAPESAIRERLRQRMTDRDPDDHSDADWPIYLRMRGHAEPVLRPHLVVNTTVSPEPVIRLLRQRLDT
jgi:predicted kinase